MKCLRCGAGREWLEKGGRMPSTEAEERDFLAEVERRARTTRKEILDFVENMAPEEQMQHADECQCYGDYGDGNVENPESCDCSMKMCEWLRRILGEEKP